MKPGSERIESFKDSLNFWIFESEILAAMADGDDGDDPNFLDVCWMDSDRRTVNLRRHLKN